MSEVTVTIANAEAALTQLESDYATAKAKITTVVQQHITAHQQAVAAHQAEVNAAQALLAKADPTATPKAQEAAAIVLTSASWVQGGINFLGRNWRYVVLGLALIMVAYGFHEGLVHFGK